MIPLIFHFPLILLTIILTIFTIVRGSSQQQFNPKGMDYQLRRPITYFYNRMAYKLDINPYTSHLLNTDLHCSSKTGPYCGFINGRWLMQVDLNIPQNWKAIHQQMVRLTPESTKIAFNIQKGNQDVFLISSDTQRKFDQIVKAQVQTHFYKPIIKKTNKVGN